ncbi:g5504 [Coccomyxa elongata]
MVVLRKRKQPEPSVAEGNGLEALLDAAASACNLVIFTGSGLSATSGMSTFSTKGGLYERAQKRFGVTDGKKLFTFSFFEKQRLEAMAFYADIYAEAKRAKPSSGHHALAAIAAMGRLQRHYTMNIDGLAECVGLTTWHPDTNPSGQTLEMHGNIHELVCPECGEVSGISPPQLGAIRAKRPLRCGGCGDADLRCRVMLYDDGEADVITPEEVFDVLEEDVGVADMILWVGISFQQSASTAYFRRVRHFLQDAGRLQKCKQVVINVSEDCLWNLLSSCSNTDDLHVIEVLASSDEALPKLAARLAQSPEAAQQPPAPLCPVPPPPREPIRRPRSRSRQTSSAAPSPSPSPDPAPDPASSLATAQGTAVAEVHGSTCRNPPPQTQHAPVPDCLCADTQPSVQRGDSGGPVRPNEAPPTPEHPQPLPTAGDDARVHIWQWDGTRAAPVTAPQCGDGPGLAERAAGDGCKPSAAADAGSAQSAPETMSGLLHSTAAAAAAPTAASTGMETAAAASTDCRLSKEVPQAAEPLPPPSAATDMAGLGDMVASALGEAASASPLLMGAHVEFGNRGSPGMEMVGCLPELDKHRLAPAGALPAN